MILWQEATKDTDFDVGTLVKFADGEIELIGNCSPGGKGTCFRGGCGCCEEECNTTYKRPDHRITHYAKILDMGIVQKEDI